MEIVLNIILALCAVFIIYELLKVVFIKRYWKMCSSKRNVLILTMDGIYTAFLVMLIVTEYWYVGLIVLVLSIVTVFGISQALRQKADLDSKTRKYLIIDGILSIVALSLPIYLILT